MVDIRSSRQSAFWIDYEYDRERASDGSRYALYKGGQGAYLRELLELFEGDPDDLRSAFAVDAWWAATGRVMSPCYVRSHERVLSCGLQQSAGQLVAEVKLMIDWPPALTASRGWRAHRVWSDRPEASGRVNEPSLDDNDLDRRSYLTCTARAVFRVDSSRLPHPDVDDLDACAAECVAVLVDELNPVVGPIVAQLAERR